VVHVDAENYPDLFLVKKGKKLKQSAESAWFHNNIDANIWEGSLAFMFGLGDSGGSNQIYTKIWIEEKK